LIDGNEFYTKDELVEKTEDSDIT